MGAVQVRGTLLTASQCATYDDTKRLWMRATGWRDGLGTHVATSMDTGVCFERCPVVNWPHGMHYSFHISFAM